jgi:RHS repeat-associated protein
MACSFYYLQAMVSSATQGSEKASGEQSKDATQAPGGENNKAAVQRKPGKISLRPLDLSRVPTHEELMMAGQLGSPLSPSRSADPAQIADGGKRKKQEDDNILFGRAIQKWNQHDYPAAMNLFRQHREKHSDSPWAGEAELHLGCAAQFSGSWDEAKFSFEWILAHHDKGTDIYQKAKLRRSVLHMDQGELEQATQSFNELLEAESDWERRTYAHTFIRQISLYKGNEVALRDCGTKALAYALQEKGQAGRAKTILRKRAPGAQGFSVAQLARFARKEAGLVTATVYAERQQLDELKVPFIAHYRDQHFVVVTGFGPSGDLRLLDPRLDRPTVLTRQQFTQQWSGLAMIFGRPPKSIRLATSAESTREMGGCCGIPRYPDNLGPEGPLECKGMPVWQVNQVNMNLVVQDVPMWHDSEIGPNIRFELTYNSQDALNQLRPFGNKWIFNYASYAMESPGGAPSGSVLVVMPGGRGDIYQPNGTGGYIAPVGLFNQLTKLGPYAFDLQTLDGTILHYGVPPEMSGFSSLLLSIEDRNHNVVTIGHNASGAVTRVTDAQGRAWVLTYNTQGLVERLDDPFQRTATFAYDANNNLRNQSDMGGMAYGYTYDSNVYLTSITKPSATTGFYIEPSGPNGGGGAYPPPGSLMWDNYRITITDARGFKEEYYWNGYSRYGWHRDKNQYLQGESTSAALTGPKTRFNFELQAGKGVVASILYADQKSVYYTDFNAARQPQTVIDENNNTVRLTYNSMGRIKTRADGRNFAPANKYVTTYTYKPNNIDLEKVADFFHDSSHPALQIDYDSNRNITSVTDGLGRSTIITPNQYGQPAIVKDNLGQERIYNYDSLHRLTSVTQNGNTLTTLVPDDVGRVVSKTDVNGLTTQYTYDRLNRLVRSIYPDTSYVENDWGCCHLDGRRDRGGNYTRFGYDEVDRLIYTFDAQNRLTEYEYDPVGNLTALLDPNFNATRWQYDKRNRVERKTFADNSRYLYDYDGAGNLKHQTDAKQIVTTYDYDLANNLKQISAAGLATITFTFDPLNRLEEMTDEGGTTVFGYSLAGELETINGPLANDTVNLAYDALGRPSGRSINNAGTATVIYDVYGRPQTSTNPLATFTYNYPNPVSTLLSSITSASGPVANFSYEDVLGDQQLNGIWHKDQGGQTISKFDMEYSVDAQVKTWTQQTGTGPAKAYQFDYDPVHQLKAAIVKDVGSGGMLKSYYYDYDAASNRTLETLDSLVTGDTPNNVNQLKTRQSGRGMLPIRGKTDEPAAVTVNGTAATVRSDSSFEGKASVTAGNNTVTVAATDANGNTTTKLYNVTVTGSGSKTFIYDFNGNLTNDGTRTLEWDALNQLVAVNSGTHRTEFTYNGLGQRTKIVEKENNAVTSTKRLIWAVTDICEERDADNNVTKRYYTQGVQIGSTSYFYTRDHLGSIRELTDAAGTVSARYDYDPYGRRTKLSGNIDADFGFTGHFYNAATGLHLAYHRPYDADLGRWLGRDPLADAELRQGPNLCAYVSNDPVNGIDPLGLEFLTDGRTALDDFREQYRRMKEANWKNSDKYFHCMANCLAASRGGIDASDAKLWSDLREFLDRHVKGDSKAACAADQAANRRGRQAAKNKQDCKSACGGYRPPGLPSKY